MGEQWSRRKRMKLKVRKKERIKKSKPCFDPNKAPEQPGLLGTLVKLMAMQRNILLIGKHGVGKTRMTLEAAKHLNIKVKYFSASTMDPYADLAGIPIADAKKKIIEFFHDSDLDRYHLFFFDEINRPQHEKVLNGLLEVVQFLRVQGRRFKKLKMCWAAMNPPNMDYDVDDIDPALLDRFHHYINVPPTYSRFFFMRKFGPMGESLLEWAKYLDKTKRDIVTPRRLEYIGDAAIQTKNNLEMLKTTVLPGSLNDTDFEVLHSKLDKYFNHDAPTKDKSAILSDMIEKQSKWSKIDVDEVMGSRSDVTHDDTVIPNGDPDWGN